MAESGVQCLTGNPCAAVQVLDQRMSSQEERMVNMDKAISALANRLPLWATLAFTACGTAIGILANKVF